MVQTLTIPKLGTVSRKIQVAPFQIPNSLPGWTTPKFVNGTGNIGALPNASFGGYWGLNYIYTNGQFTKNPTSAFDVGGAYQLAGGVVQSFGIYDFYAGPSLTGTKTSPYGGGGGENFAQSWWAQGRNSLYLWRSTSFNGVSGSVWPGYVRVAAFPLPNIQFNKTLQTAMNPDLVYSYSCIPPASGNLFAQPSPVIIEPMVNGANLLIPPATYANVNLGNPLAASSKVSVAPYRDPFHPVIPLAGPTAEPYFVQTGPVTTAGALLAGIQGQWGLTFSPLWNTYAGFLNGTGLMLTPLLIQDAYLTQGNNQVITHSVVVTLSDAADQADIIGFRLGGGWTVMPDGNFLVQSPNNANVFYIINPTGNGYYKVVMSGVTLAGNWASGGYGVDLNGNFWSFSTVAGQLAGTLGLPQPPIFLPFPQTSANWVGCRHNTCAYPWYG